MKQSVFLLALCLMPLCVVAQESAFQADARPSVQLQGYTGSVMMMDNQLLCQASGILFNAGRIDGQVVAYAADTQFVKLHSDVTFVTRHPAGDIYFTRPDRRGHSYLYCAHTDTTKSGRPKTSVDKVDLGGYTVEHPAFTADGRIMVFSSRGKNPDRSDYDLWYSVFTEGKWQRPLNLGPRLNTSADDVAPSLYCGMLFFASNGHSADPLHFNIYSSQLISTRVTGDTVGMLQIGRSHVQRLPFNIAGLDNIDFVVDTASPYCYFVTRSRDSVTVLHAFPGMPDGVMLWGRVADAKGVAIPNVAIEVSSDGMAVCRTATDNDGIYRLYLRSDADYQILYRIANHFADRYAIHTAAADPERIISETRRDVVLDRIELDRRHIYMDLFGPNADVELSAYGRNQLAPLVQFLVDNPMLSATLSLSNDLTDNPNFNRYLTDSRLLSLQRHLQPLLPSSVRLTFENASPASDATASGQSRLVVVISR